jgi:hypothetical protein
MPSVSALESNFVLRPITVPACRALMIELRDAADNVDPIEQADPIENAERADPIDPTDRTEPIDPTDNSDPRLPMHSIESSDQSDHFEFRPIPTI